MGEQSARPAIFILGIIARVDGSRHQPASFRVRDKNPFSSDVEIFAVVLPPAPDRAVREIKSFSPPLLVWDQDKTNSNKIPA